MGTTTLENSLESASKVEDVCISYHPTISTVGIKLTKSLAHVDQNTLYVKECL